tara:strand:- start:322 stop:597 length:276 start_codon:yes stop_codon:yes gene_type:complete
MTEITFSFPQGVRAGLEANLRTSHPIMLPKGLFSLRLIYLRMEFRLGDHWRGQGILSHITIQQMMTLSAMRKMKGALQAQSVGEAHYQRRI